MCGAVSWDRQSFFFGQNVRVQTALCPDDEGVLHMQPGDLANENSWFCVHLDQEH